MFFLFLSACMSSVGISLLSCRNQWRATRGGTKSTCKEKTAETKLSPLGVPSKAEDAKCNVLSYLVYDKHQMLRRALRLQISLKARASASPRRQGKTMQEIGGISLIYANKAIK